MSKPNYNNMIQVHAISFESIQTIIEIILCANSHKIINLERYFLLALTLDELFSVTVAKA